MFDIVAIKSLTINHYTKTKLTFVTLETNLKMSKMTIQVITVTETSQGRKEGRYFQMSFFCIFNSYMHKTSKRF